MKKRDYFGGWYFKCQNGEKTLAVIPAFHRTRGEPSCSIQIITDSGAFCAVFPADEWKRNADGFADIGRNRFRKSGMELDICEEGFTVRGKVVFGTFTPIKYDIMGPFSAIPFMECRHTVISMYHGVVGEITLNGEKFVFENGKGYIEGDSGYSFPKVYAWTHCFVEKGSVMLSVAEIPFGFFRFTGVIGVAYIDGAEHRIATYLGARAKSIKGGAVDVKQGKTRFFARLVSKRDHPLFAPASGAMTRTIRESASCSARYVFEKDGKTLLDESSDLASFEYEFNE